MAVPSVHPGPLVARRKKGTHYSRSRRSLGVSLPRQPTRFLFRFQPEEKGCRRRPALSRDKGSFRLTARPLDGPKAPRLPSPPSNLFPTSPPCTWKPYVQDVSHPDVSFPSSSRERPRRVVSCRGVSWRGVVWREVARVFSRQPRGHLSSWIPLTNFDTLKIQGWGKKMKLVHYKRAKNVSLFFHVSLFLQGSYLGNTFTYLAYKFICKDGIERTIPKNHFNFLFDLRIGLHLFAFIQNFASSLKKKEKRKISSISLILCSNAVLR